MKFEKNNIVTLGNKKEYVIIETLNHNGKQYLYLSCLDEINLSVVRIDYKNDSPVFAKLDNDEFEEVLGIFANLVVENNQ